MLGLPNKMADVCICMYVFQISFRMLQITALLCFCFLLHGLLIPVQTQASLSLGLHFFGLSKMLRNFPLVISLAGKERKETIG